VFSRDFFDALLDKPAVAPFFNGLIGRSGCISSPYRDCAHRRAYHALSGWEAVPWNFAEEAKSLVEFADYCDSDY